MVKDRKETKVVEVSNGWAKINLEKLLTGSTHTLEIHAGSPIRPFILDQTDVRKNRKGFFSGLRKAFGSEIRSQLTIKYRALSDLLTIKQVIIH